MEKVYGVIYKITNKINGKVYIGQTSSDLEYRISQHIISATYRKGILYSAIKKYGWQNFCYEKIDEAYSEKELHEKEIFYIEKFRSFCGFKDSHGYNATLGGEGTRGLSKVLKVEDVILIKKMLVETNHSMVYIAKVFETSFGCVNSIYLGRTWGYVNVDGFYPSMKRETFFSKKIEINDVIEIKKMLISKEFTLDEIGNKFGLSRKYISQISAERIFLYIKVDGFEKSVDNIGENNGSAKLTEKDVLDIRKMYNDGVSNIEIGKIYDIHPIHVKDICRGNSWGHIKELINTEGKSHKGESNPSSKLTLEQVEEIRMILETSNEKMAEIGKRFNISIHMISKINTGKSWKSENLTYPIRKKKS